MTTSPFAYVVQQTVDQTGDFSEEAGTSTGTFISLPLSPLFLTPKPPFHGKINRHNSIKCLILIDTFWYLMVPEECNHHIRNISTILMIKRNMQV